MSNYPVKPEQLYPFAQVPNATSTQEVFDAWQARGMTPTQVTTEDVTQSISISHNALLNTLQWSTHKMDGIQACGILFRTLIDVATYFFKSTPRPKLSSGNGRIMVQLDENGVSFIGEPTNDMPVLTGMLVAVLIHLLTTKDITPETLSSLMRFTPD